MYKIGRRSESREKKFVAARALVAEMNRAFNIAQSGRSSSSPAPRGDAAIDPASSGAQPADSTKPAIDERGKGAEDAPQPRPIPGMPRRVYEGLITSGGLFYLEPALQLRLHVFYAYVEQGDLGAADWLIWPLMQETARFRDANAPFARSDLAWPLRRAASGLRGWRHGRRRAASGAGGGGAA